MYGRYSNAFSKTTTVFIRPYWQTKNEQWVWKVYTFSNEKLLVHRAWGNNTFLLAIVTWLLEMFLEYRQLPYKSGISGHPPFRPRYNSKTWYVSTLGS